MLLARFSVLGSFIRPDPVQTHHGMTLNRNFSGQALRNDSLRLSGASHTAILTKLVRISIFETVASDKLRVVEQEPRNSLSHLKRSSRWTADR